MKTLLNISRIATCVLVSFYTLYVCAHVSYSTYMSGYRITVQGDDGYGAVHGAMVLGVVPAVVLLLLGVACIVLLLRRSRLAALCAAACAVAGALLGISLDTRLSEYMFVRYPLGLTGITPEQVLSFKPWIAAACTVAAVLYAILFQIYFYHLQRKENLS